jgi:Autographiviridae RNA polymerase
MIDPKLPLEARQKALELEMRGLGILQYRRLLRLAREKGREGSTQHGGVLIKRALDDVAEGLVGFLSEMGESQRGPQAGACPLLRRVDPRVAALIGLRVIIDGLISGTPLAAMASKVGRRLEDEARFQVFRRVAPTRFDKVKEEVRRASTYRHKRTVAVHRANKLGVEWPRFNQAERLRAGMVLLEIVEQRTGYIQFRLVRRHKHQTERIVQATPALRRWIEKQTARCEVLCPRYLPSYMEPRPWGQNARGGYHFPQVIGDMHLVKTRFSEHRELIQRHASKMPLVLEAVNALQATPWQVNGRVLEIARKAWNRGVLVEGLPPREDLPLPPRPHDIATNEEARRAWRREAFPIRDYNARSLAKRLLVARTLWTAEQFAGEASFYYVHQLDFRGRAYPLVSGLSPQGGDLARGLLRFARGMPIEDANGGPWWLAVHGANCFGFDKAPLADRVAYIEAMNDEIEAIAADPFAVTSWTRADAPFQFLAFCFEWAEYLRTGDGYVSHLPVAMDATCSGIQHFSAMLCDPVGAAATNLAPSPTKADIYQAVCDKLVQRFTDDLQNHKEPAWKGSTWSTASAARGWLSLKPDRTTTKKQVMVTPYGATRRGYERQTEEWLLERRELLPWPPSDCRRMAGFAAGRLKLAIDETVVGAAEVMRWLKAVAKVMCLVSKPLHWVTPAGFPVFQHYLSSRKQAVWTALGDLKVRVTFREEGEGKDPTEMRNSIAPNFVHSMDAAHMMQTIRLALVNGIRDFAAIHDSFATHAARSADFATVIREAFVLLYEDDVLADFIAQLRAQLPLELRLQLPKPPPRGAFDIALVRDSEFFFS